MDLTEYVSVDALSFQHPNIISCSFKSVTIPQREDPRLAALTKRCESCKPMGMFRSSENEFLLCYDGQFTLGFAAFHFTRTNVHVRHRIRVIC